MREIICLEHADDVQVCGNKAATLAGLKKKGLLIPEGAVITTEYFYDFVLQNGMTAEEVDNIKSSESMEYRKLSEVLKKGKWSKALYEDMKRLYDAVPHPLCVRSSGTTEDGTVASMAGYYHSCVNVRNFSEFLSAVKECWLSAFHPQIIAQLNKLNLSCRPIPLLVQNFQPSVVSGVAFYTKDRVIISSTYGLCTGVVSGNTVCDEYVWNREDGEWNKRIAYKDKCYLPISYEQQGKFGSSRYFFVKWKNGVYQEFELKGTNNDFSVGFCVIIRFMPVLTDDELERVKGWLRNISEKLNIANLDCEWCLDAEGTIHLLQARPFLADKFSRPGKRKRELQESEYQGVAISQGVHVGKVVHYRRESDKEKINQGDVVLLEVIPDDFIDIISHVGAIVLRSEVLLSHCAIIAREWGIPCIGGIALEKFNNGDLCKVDGENGVIGLMTPENK